MVTKMTRRDEADFVATVVAVFTAGAKVGSGLGVGAWGSGMTHNPVLVSLIVPS